MPAPAKGSKKDKNATKTEKKAEEKAPEKVPTPPPAVPAKLPEDPAVASGSKKPDQAAYNAEQETIKKEIDALNVKLVCFFATVSFPQHSRVHSM